MPAVLTWAPLKEAQAWGNGYGWSYSAECLRRELATLGAIGTEASVAFSYGPPHLFRPTPGKVSALFTMFESRDLPADMVAAIQRADVLFVPSGFCARIFRQHTDVPIHVVPLGVESFPVVPRTYPPAGTPFRWLWVAAFNVRKGWAQVARIWDDGLMPDAELYLKTTPLSANGAQEIRQHHAMILDTRNVSRDELGALYASAHGFVFPTLGEGFGLTLAEAMSTGLPCVASDWGGHLQFATRATCRLVPVQVERITNEGTGPGSVATDGKFEVGMVMPGPFAAAMRAVMNDYTAARAMGLRAARAVRELTWRHAAQRVAELCRQIGRHQKGGGMRRAAQDPPTLSPVWEGCA